MPFMSHIIYIFYIILIFISFIYFSSLSKFFFLLLNDFYLSFYPVYNGKLPKFTCKNAKRYFRLVNAVGLVSNCGWRKTEGGSRVRQCALSRHCDVCVLDSHCLKATLKTRSELMKKISFFSAGDFASFLLDSTKKTRKMSIAVSFTSYCGNFPSKTHPLKTPS